ncbi:MAG: hypothetical protein AAGA68_27460, partial [Pseudomonadota bacterium]
DSSAHLVHCLGGAAATKVGGAHRDPNHIETGIGDRDAGDRAHLMATNDDLAGQVLQAWEIRKPCTMGGRVRHTLGAHQAAIAVKRDRPAIRADGVEE